MLRISRGTWRIVVVIPALGVALKIPNIRFEVIWNRYKSLRSIKGFVKKASAEIRYWEHPASSIMCLFGGISMSFQEFFFSLSYGSSSLVLPTYFSFFGLINIMPAGEECERTRLELWGAALTVAEFEKLDPHTWSNPKNFVRDRKGHLRLADYGDPRTRQVLRQYRASFERVFAML